MPKFLGHGAKYFSHYYYGMDTLNFQTGVKKPQDFQKISAARGSVLFYFCSRNKGRATAFLAVALLDYL